VVHAPFTVEIQRRRGGWRRNRRRRNCRRRSGRWWVFARRRRRRRRRQRRRQPNKSSSSSNNADEVRAARDSGGPLYGRHRRARGPGPVCARAGGGAAAAERGRRTNRRRRRLFAAAAAPAGRRRARRPAPNLCLPPPRPSSGPGPRSRPLLRPRPKILAFPGRPRRQHHGRRDGLAGGGGANSLGRRGAGRPPRRLALCRRAGRARRVVPGRAQRRGVVQPADRAGGRDAAGRGGWVRARRAGGGR
jgi:hypothetical protein